MVRGGEVTATDHCVFAVHIKARGQQTQQAHLTTGSLKFRPLGRCLFREDDSAYSDEHDDAACEEKKEPQITGASDSRNSQQVAQHQDGNRFLPIKDTKCNHRAHKKRQRKQKYLR